MEEKKQKKGAVVDTQEVLADTDLKKIFDQEDKEAEVASESGDKQLVFLPVASLKEGSIFPGMSTRMLFSRRGSIASLTAAKLSENMVLILSQKDSNLDNPKGSDLHQIGVIIEVNKVERTEKGLMVNFQAVKRARVVHWVRQELMLLARVKVLEDKVDLSDDELNLLGKHLLDRLQKLLDFGVHNVGEGFLEFLQKIPVAEAVDHVANVVSAKAEKKQEILETLSLSKRLKMVLEALETELQVLKIEKAVISKTNEKLEKNMKESILRERLQMIQKELGETDDETEVADEYNKQLETLQTTAENKEKIAKELRRFRQTHSMSPENGYLRTWLETVFELPWGKYDNGKLEIRAAGQILDDSHYGLNEVKDRILEYIAVLQMREKRKKVAKVPTILCFVGPPGVGKTSIGKSIAQALGRKFTKISLGGVNDEAEIRGHRRTYVGAMEGRIIAGLKQAGTSNPVFMLDEIDKLSGQHRGDPSAALLEVLDPAQNQNFEDNYLDMPYDLSQVTFIATANTLNIPQPLLDRMEVIRYSGYTSVEKREIARRYLLPRAIGESGLRVKDVQISLPILTYVIEKYTKEAGVRELKRQLEKLMRKAAKEILLEGEKRVKLDKAKVEEYLGVSKYDVSLRNKKSEVGVATGLAWTSVGGEVLFVVVVLTPGKGGLRLTGKLGEVMKESAQAALTFVRANAKKLGLKDKFLHEIDIHIHVPEGAVPKDGPSAGVTMTTALVSALTKKAVRKDIAMTGEVNLRGQVLRIGGLKEKAIAAHRAGCKVVLIPADNVGDVAELPELIKKEIEFVPCQTVWTNLERALK